MTHNHLDTGFGSNAAYQQLFDALPTSNLLLAANPPYYTIVAVSPLHIIHSGIAKKDLIGKGIFETFPSNPDDTADTGETNMRSSLQHVLQHNETHQLPLQRYDVIDERGQFIERYWRVENKPVFGVDGKVAFILHTTEELTAKIKAEQRELQMKVIEKAFSLFMHAPMVVGLVNGDDYVMEMANDAAFKLWGKGPEILGKPILQGLPELEGQGIIELFDQVRSTGKPFIAHEVPITSFVNGKERQHFFDLVYQPYYSNESNRASGVFTISHDVTEQVKARQKALVSEEKYRNLFESMDQGYCTMEILFEDDRCVDYRYLETNPTFERQSGLINAVGKTIREMAPGIESYWFEFFGNVVETGNPNHIIDESKALNKWFEINAIRLGSADERKVGVFFTDVTERKKAEEAIRLSESNLRNTILQAPVAMAILKGPSFIVEIANNYMYELWGRSKEILLNEALFEKLPEVKDQGYEELLTHVFTTGERYTAQGVAVLLPREKGIEKFYINLLYEAFREIDGTITGVIVVASDVTDQVMARHKIEESHREFQFITDFMPQMFWLTKPDGYHYYYNQRWYEYTGLTLVETEGEGWNKAFHPDDQQRALQLWRKSLITGVPYEIEYRCRRYDGEYRWVLGRALPLKDKSGAIVKWFGSCTDIHDQKIAAELMEQKVEERTRELRQVNEQLKQFTYAASHDLQEPLRKIGYFIDRLLMNIGPGLNEDNKKITDRIQHTSARMRSLIDDLLAYSNTSQGVTGFENVDLNTIVREVIDDMEATIIEKNAVVNVQVMPTVTGDQRQLKQLLQNIISNALKYNNKGVPPQIDITTTKVRGGDTTAFVPEERNTELFYLIEIKDNGIGFDPDNAERIFRLFQRLHGKAEYEGTGVGLALVQQVAENHKGFVWAESTPGMGSTFKLILPVV